MNGRRASPFIRRPFWLALALSLMLHLSALVAPGWHLPLLDDEETPATLDATLVVPVRVQPAPAPKSLPPPKKRPSPPSPPVGPVVGVPADTLAVPAAAVASAPEPESAPAPAPVAEPQPAAVPPAPTFAYANIWPKSGRIVFQVTRGEGGLIVGRNEHRWTHDEQNYALHAQAETIGLAALFRPAKVAQTSRGKFAANGLQPVEFKTERDGKPKDSANLEALQGEALPVQDMLSLFYQLGAATLDVPEFAVQVHTGRKVARFVVAVGETLTLDSPLGARSVRHLKVVGGPGEDSTEIWLDTVTRLPLKIRHRDRKGEVFDQTATTITLDKPE